tara:strand:+ start:303 stop:1376 length:1074 start_codon:yes stop_codon:yes gene_type:complete
MGIFDFLSGPGVVSGINQGIQQLRIEDNDKFSKYLDRAVDYVETQALPLLNESKKLATAEIRVAKRLRTMGVKPNVIKALASRGKGGLSEFYATVQQVNFKYASNPTKQISGEDINNAVVGAEQFKNEDETVRDYITNTYMPNIDLGMDKVSAFDISGARGRAYKELDDYAGTVLADGTSLTYKDLYTLVKGGSYTGFGGEDMGVTIDQTVLQQSFQAPLQERLYDQHANSAMLKIQSYGATTDKAVELLEADNSDMGLLLNEYATRMFPNQKDAFIAQTYSQVEKGQAAVTGASTNLYMGFNELISSNNERTPFTTEAVARAWAKVIGVHSRYDKPIFFIKEDGTVGKATVSELIG